MKDQLVMSPNNGAVCIAIPLYRHHHEEPLANLDGYSVTLTKDKPIMYAMDIGDDSLQAFNAAWVEKNLEFLGDL